MQYKTLKTLVKRDCARGILAAHVRKVTTGDEPGSLMLWGKGNRSIVIHQNKNSSVTHITLFEEGLIRNPVADTRGYYVVAGPRGYSIAETGDTEYEDFAQDLEMLFMGHEIADLDDESDCDCRNPRA